MPLYEFACQKCKHTFEELVFDGEAVACPKCQSKKVGKLLSVPSRPQSSGLPMSSACGDPSLPPCGAPWCQRTGK